MKKLFKLEGLGGNVVFFREFFIAAILLLAPTVSFSVEYKYDGEAPTYLDKSHIVYQDGDTIEYDLNNNDKIDKPNEIIRLVGYDAPECAQPWFTGSQEPYASQAKASLMKAVAKAKVVYLKRLNYPDKYMRTLAHLYVDNVPVAAIAVRDKWGKETVSRYGIQGFPAEAAMVLEMAKNAKYQFEDPWVWRRKFSKGTPK